MKPAFRALIITFLAASGFGSVAHAQPASAVCDGVQQDRAACQREAGAARQEARRDGLTTAPSRDETQNSLDRCKSQPPAARSECEARIRGTGGAGRTKVEGSVMGGGVIRETVTPIPAPKP